MFEKETQEKLREEFKTLLSGVWNGSERMINHCNKSADVIYKTSKGFILSVDKQNIKKHFCFGYSDSRYDTEDFDRANKMAHHAKTSVDYFREENLSELKHIIEIYEKNPQGLTFYFRNHYHSQPDNILKCVEGFHYWEIPSDINDTSKYVLLTEDDIKLVVAAYKKELELFTKRLDTYIKRYGLSKVRTWSYWQDA